MLLLGDNPRRRSVTMFHLDPTTTIIPTTLTQITTFQTVFTTLEKIRGRFQPSRHHQPPSRTKTKLTQPFRNAKHIPPAFLEKLYISCMSDGFVQACPGDVLSIKVMIADNKSRGSFTHENRPKLPALREHWWGQTLHNDILDKKAVTSLSLRAKDPFTVASLKMSGTSESVIDIKAAAELGEVFLANCVSLDLFDVDSASSKIKSPAHPSVAWISLEGLKLPDVSLDLGTCVTDASKDLLNDTDEVNPVTWEMSKFTSAPAIIPAALNPKVLLRVEFYDVKAIQPETPSPVSTSASPTISESGAPVHMGFGRVKDRKLESEIPLTLSPPVVLPLNIIKKSSATIVISLPVLPPSPSSSFLGYFKAEGGTIIAEESHPQMLDTLRRKKSVAAVVTTPLVARSSSESLHRYLRADGKEIAIHALSGEHYLEMPETPFRFQKHVKNITPSSAEDIASFLAFNYDESKKMADSFREFDPLAVQDIFGPKEYPRATFLPAEDFIVINPGLSHVFNLPHRTSGMCRVVNKMKGLSRVGPNKENLPSSFPAKSSRVSAYSFSHSFAHT